MNLILQVLIFFFALLYKYLLARNKFLGWVFSAVAGALSALYLIWYAYMPILLSLESGFFILSLYGMYKHKTKIDYLTLVDKIVIGVTFLAIIFLVRLQIASHTVWYEVIASTAYLAGVVLLAQKKNAFKITGWILFSIGSISYAYIMWGRGAYILVALDTISLTLSIYAIRNILRAKKKQQLAS